MVVERIGGRFATTGLRRWPVGFCVLGALALFALAGKGLHRVHAQSTPTAQTADAADAQDTATPASTSDAAEKPGAASESPASVTPAPAAMSSEASSPEQQRKQEVAGECANMLKMATELKAEVDKTTKDELSIAVVRKAGELEQFAHKVRGDTRLTAGK
jgi:hypothetical protein